MFQALQGAARMALQVGAHPAQIKDAVTSKSCCLRVFTRRLTITSTWWLHDCRSVGSGRWEGPFNNRPSDSSGHGTRERTRTAKTIATNPNYERAIVIITEKLTTPRRYWMTATMELVAEARAEPSRPGAFAEPTTLEPPWILQSELFKRI